MFPLFSGPASPAVSVHETCAEQSLKLLAADGKHFLANALDTVLPWIHQGSRWTDQNLRNLSHFYHPLDKKGLPGVHHAGQEMTAALLEMEKAWHRHNPARYFFCLGIVLHLVQDLCVPHHVFGCLLQGHHHYESWVSDHHRQFLAHHPIGTTGNNPLKIMESNALTAMAFEDLLNQPSEDRMREATAFLFPLAQHSSATLLSLFSEPILQIAGLVKTAELGACRYLKEA